jgi:hypothetical protein
MWLWSQFGQSVHAQDKCSKSKRCTHLNSYDAVFGDNDAIVLPTSPTLVLQLILAQSGCIRVLLQHVCQSTLGHLSLKRLCLGTLETLHITDLQHNCQPTHALLDV